MNKIAIKVPKGIQFISEWKEYQIPKGHCIVDKGVTGCGYTEFCLTNDKNVILCSPRKLLLENKRDQHKTDPGIMYLENDIDGFESFNNYKNKVIDHYKNCIGPFNVPCKILVTYDSCHYVVEALSEEGILGDFIFVVDEFQSIFQDAFFKATVELDFVTVLNICPNIIYLSATPMLDKYLDCLNEFKDLDMYKLDWSDSEYVENISIKRKNTNSLSYEAKSVVNRYLLGKFYMVVNPITGEPEESREAVMYFNSVTEIVRLIKSMNLTPKNTIVICSDTKDNRRKLKKVNFSVGKIPLKDDPYPMFMLCTSTSYIGVDMYSKCASTFIFSDPNIKCLATDIHMDLPQIVGRQRNKNNLFKNDVTIFYKIQQNPITQEEFIDLQQKRRETTEVILRNFENLDPMGKVEIAKALKSDVLLRKYEDNFIGVSELNNYPAYNYLVELANERAWEISQLDYKDNVSVIKAIENSGFSIENYFHEDELLVNDFLDNQFYKTGIFSEKMKMYCEFMDQHGDNKKIIDLLNYKIIDKRYFRYYEYFGSNRCKELKYLESEFRKSWKESSLQSLLEEKIRSMFKVGDRISMSEIKTRLNNLNHELGISTKAKSTDIYKYFSVIKTKIALSDKSRVDGFKIIGEL